MTVFDIILIIVSFLWVLSEVILNISRRVKNGRKDKISFQLIFVVISVSVCIGVFIYVYSRIHDLRWLYLSNIYISIAGLILIITGIIIRWTAILTLKRYFSVNVTIIDDHKIIKSGMYKWIRHPAYTGSLLSILGLGLSYSNWLSLIVIFIPVLTIFILRIKAEEKVLMEHFGKEYKEYRKETKYLIPFVF